MSINWTTLSAAAVLLPLVAGCAQTGTASKPRDAAASGFFTNQSSCYVAFRSGKCRFAHDKAGGAPYGAGAR